MKKVLGELIRKRAAAEEAIKEAKSTILATNAAIRAIQDICDHLNEDGTEALSYTGHDSHYDHYECLICGKTISA